MECLALISIIILEYVSLYFVFIEQTNIWYHVFMYCGQLFDVLLVVIMYYFFLSHYKRKLFSYIKIYNKNDNAIKQLERLFHCNHVVNLCSNTLLSTFKQTQDVLLPLLFYLPLIILP